MVRPRKVDVLASIAGALAVLGTLLLLSSLLEVVRSAAAASDRAGSAETDRGSTRRWIGSSIWKVKGSNPLSSTHPGPRPASGKCWGDRFFHSWTTERFASGVGVFVSRAQGWTGGARCPGRARRPGSPDTVVEVGDDGADCGFVLTAGVGDGPVDVLHPGDVGAFLAAAEVDGMSLAAMVSPVRSLGTSLEVPRPSFSSVGDLGVDVVRQTPVAAGRPESRPPA